MPTPPPPPANRLLALLPPADFRRLSPCLQAVTLPARRVLHEYRSPIDYVYFPTGGLVSAVTRMGDGAAIEVAAVGSEGVVGLTAFVGGESSPNELVVRVAGHGLRVAADVLLREAGKDGPLRRLLGLYHTAYATQVSYAAACNGLHKVEQRCCRWLLAAADRVGSAVLPLTHESLAATLGVRRASVTQALRLLQQRGLVENSRGVVRVVDRPGLEATSCECYRAVKGEFTRLFG